MGFFETLLSREGQVLFWPEHQFRLFDACRAFQVPIPDVDLKEAMVEVLLALQLTNQTCKINVHVFLEPAPSWIITAATIDLKPSIPVAVHPVVFHPHPRLSQFKSHCYWPYRLALQEAQAAQAFEALLVNEGGEVLEGSFSAFFAQKGRHFWITPPRGRLPSVTLGLLNRQLNFGIRPMRVHELAQMDHLFLVNSLRGCLPIAKVGSQTFAVNQELATRWSRMILGIESPPAGPSLFC
jgi:branched-subunit amino acid aminotransferase/4-amino-4-deoxychorismate lyase